MKKAEKNCLAKGITVLLSLFVISTPVSSQDCDPLTLDSISNPGQFNVATMVESDGFRNGPDYAGATIYYPLNATPPFASIAIVPGFVSPESSIQDWGPFLASHGIVVMTIGTNSPFDDPYARRDGLLDAIVTIVEENTRPDSPLIGDLDLDRIAVAGWSMGGGGAQLAAAADPTLKAVLAFCPWLDNQTTETDLDHAVPVLIFSAENDAIAPHADHADIHYDYTPTATYKMLFEIDNAGHTVANSPTGGDDQVGKIGLSWLKNFLLNDNCYCPLLLDTPSMASAFMTTVSCEEDPTTIEDLYAVTRNFSKLYPNPAIGSIHLELDHLDDRMSYEILSTQGVKVMSGRIDDQDTSIDIHHLHPGMYVMTVITPEASERLNFIVLQ